MGLDDRDKDLSAPAGAAAGDCLEAQHPPTLAQGPRRNRRRTGAAPTASRVSRRNLLVTFGGLGTGLLLGACSGRPGVSAPDAPANVAPAPSATSSTGPAAPTASATAAAIPTAPASARVKKVPRDRTLVSVGVPEAAPSFSSDIEMQNPYLPGITRSGYQVVMEPLFYYNPYHTTAVCGPPSVPNCTDGIIPWLGVYAAENADYTSAIVNLRQGVTWSDGQPFTARDVVFTVNMLRANAPNLTWSIDMREWVQDVSAPDDYTVAFTLTHPNPRFLFTYFQFHQDVGVPIVPEHIWQGKNPLTFTNFDLARGWPVTTGPYRLVYSDAQQKIWDRRDDWWGATTGFHALPAPERLVFVPGRPQATLADMVDKNQADTTLNLGLAQIKSAVRGSPNVTSWTGNQAPYGYIDYWVTGLGFNDSRAPFDDPGIRNAINSVIDRQALVRDGYDGAGEIAVLPYPDFPALRPYINGVSDLVQRYAVNTYDPRKTAQLMQSKHYTQDAAGFWTLGGKRLAIPMVIPRFEHDITVALVDQLRKAGFDASFQIVDDYTTPILTGQATAYVFGHDGSIRDPYRTMHLYEQVLSAPTGQRAVEPYRWHNGKFDSIVNQMATVAAGDPQLETLFREALTIWLPELPDIPLVQYYHRIPVNTTYWSGWPDQTNPYINTAFWHRTFELIVLSLRPT